MVENPVRPPSEKVSLRAAKRADAPALARLATQLGYPSSAAQVEARMTTMLRDPLHLVLLAVSGGRVVGWVHAHVVRLLESDAFAELGGLVVDESHRGQGVGRKLMEKVEDWARQKGCGNVSIRSNVTRLEAHNFYAACGYEKTKTQHRFRKGL